MADKKYYIHARTCVWFDFNGLLYQIINQIYFVSDKTLTISTFNHT